MVSGPFDPGSEQTQSEAQLIQAVRAKADRTRVMVVTRNYQFEGFMYTPKVGKDSRRLTDALNADKNFINITDVSITNRSNGAKDPNPHKVIQVAMAAIEFIKPFFD